MSDRLSLNIRISTIIKREDFFICLTILKLGKYFCKWKHQNLKAREMAQWLNKVVAAKPGDLNSTYMKEKNQFLQAVL